MLAYAAHRRRIAQRNSAPHVMLAIIVGHIALIAAVMSAKMDLPDRLRDITRVELIPIPADPPPRQPPPREVPRTSDSRVDRVPPIVPVPQPRPEPLDPPIMLPVPQPGPLGPLPVPQPKLDPAPTPPVRVGPRFATPADSVRPPYPPSKIASDEEAVLKLKLAIDPRGRVVAVDSVGRADPAFLAAARRHLLAHWRYKPATEDGRPIASSTVITLRFELD